MKNITKIYCEIDDFCKIFVPEFNKQLISTGNKKRNKPSKLSVSEVITIMILFHSGNFRNFKHFYIEYVNKHLKSYFPDLVSYNRFVELQQSATIPMFAYFHCVSRGEKTGIYFIDSTTLKVSNNKRIYRHKVFQGLAKRGKTSMGWFFGFKLHLIVNDLGEIISFALTPGNTSDNDINLVTRLAKEIAGKLFGDKGYISQELFEALFDSGLKLITGIRKNMKNKLVELEEKLLLRKRSIIETINDQLKNISQIEHSRHRSPANFFVNLLSGLLAYSLKDRKPKIDLSGYANQLVFA